MRDHLICLALASSLLSPFVSAQVQMSAGVQAGVNIANASYTSTFSGVTSSPRTGLLIGGIVTLQIPERLCFRIEPMYVQNGASMKIEEGNVSYEQEYKLEYLEFPIHVMLQFGDGALRPYIFGGPNLGILLAANLEEEMPAYLSPEFRQSGTHDITNDVSSWNFSVDLGGGMSYDIAPDIRLLIDVRYSFGLTDIATPPHPNDQGFLADSWKSRDVKILAGVLFVL